MKKVSVSATNLAAAAEETATYEVIFEVWMHVINSVVHDSRCNALACEAQCPRWLDVQIKLRYTTRLASVVLHSHTPYNSTIHSLFRF